MDNTNVDDKTTLTVIIGNESVRYFAEKLNAPFALVSEYESTLNSLLASINTLYSVPATRKHST